jgi:hypothetical protein
MGATRSGDSVEQPANARTLENASSARQTGFSFCFKFNP